MSLLKIENVTQAFFTELNWKLVLDDISLTLGDGEFLSVLGPSGCGKTTLLSVVAGMLIPTNGSVLLDDERINRPTSQIGYMLQQDYLFPWLSIEENIELGLRITKIYSEETKSYAMNLLCDVGLEDTLKLKPHELSGGMRQRAALVRTLVTNPKLLLLDEPFSALDYQTKIRLEQLVFSKLRDFQKAAILVTHDIEEAIAVSDRIILLSRNPGRIAKEFLVPTSVRECPPLIARGKSEFHELFHMIWKEMESLE